MEYSCIESDVASEYDGTEDPLMIENTLDTSANAAMLRPSMKQQPASKTLPKGAAEKTIESSQSVSSISGKTSRNIILLLRCNYCSQLYQNETILLQHEKKCQQVFEKRNTHGYVPVNSIKATDLENLRKRLPQVTVGVVRNKEKDTSSCPESAFLTTQPSQCKFACATPAVSKKMTSLAKLEASRSPAVSTSDPDPLAIDTVAVPPNSNSTTTTITRIVPKKVMSLAKLKAPRSPVVSTSIPDPLAIDTVPVSRTSNSTITTSTVSNKVVSLAKPKAPCSPEVSTSICDTLAVNTGPVPSTSNSTNPQTTTVPNTVVNLADFKAHLSSVVSDPLAFDTVPAPPISNSIISITPVSTKTVISLAMLDSPSSPEISTCNSPDPLDFYTVPIQASSCFIPSVSIPSASVTLVTSSPNSYPASSLSPDVAANVAKHLARIENEIAMLSRENCKLRESLQMSIDRPVTAEENWEKLNTRSQLEEFEAKLGTDTVFAGRMFARLKRETINCKPRTTIARSLEFLISRQLLASCSWTGAGKQIRKIPFCNLKRTQTLLQRVVGRQVPANVVEEMLRNLLYKARKKLQENPEQRSSCHQKTGGLSSNNSASEED